MANSYASLYVHIVFSTKLRKPLIEEEYQSRLWSYMGGAARDIGVKPIIIGGTEDHVHALFSLPPTIPVSKLVQTIKAGSSRWIHETIAQGEHFEWQEGYGAFSIGISLMEETTRYIQNQTEHHRKKTFQEEYLEFLKRNKIQYDERYVWG